MNQYRKAIVAGVGFLAASLSAFAGFTLLEDAETQLLVVNAIVAALTTFGVYQFPNEPSR